MNKRSLRLFLAAALACFLVFLLFINAGKRSVSGYAMGTMVEVRGQHAEKALKEIKRLEKLFDKNKVGSDVWLINSLAGIASVEVNDDTIKVIKEALEASKLTNGAFDITRKNYRCVAVDQNKKTVYLTQKGLNIDLGGIGKGYAAEAARRILKRLGSRQAIIDMVSSIAVIGAPDGGKAWKIGIKDPRRPDELIATIELRDGQALSTSGVYERGGHILDPGTGKSARSDCASVTVVGRDAGLADALSTAVFVLGAEKGIKVLGSVPVDGYFIVLKDGRILKK